MGNTTSDKVTQEPVLYRSLSFRDKIWKTKTTKRIPPHDYEALQYLKGDELSTLVTSVVNNDGNFASVTVKSFADLMHIDKLMSEMRSEQISLSRDEMDRIVNLGISLNDMEKDMKAFIKLLPDKHIALVYAFDLDHLSCARYLIKIRIPKMQKIPEAGKNVELKTTGSSEADGHTRSENRDTAVHTLSSPGHCLQRDTDKSAKELLTEMDLLKYNALECLLGKDFTRCIKPPVKINDQRVIVQAKDCTALEYIKDKLNSLRQESVSLTPDLTVPSEDWLKVITDGVGAFIKMSPDKKAINIFSFNCPSTTIEKLMISIRSIQGEVAKSSEGKFYQGGSVVDVEHRSSPDKTSSIVSKATTIKYFTTKSGIKASVYKADITQLTVDAIVNAANEHLAHDGGVAAAIRKAAGLDLQTESDHYVKHHGPLKVTTMALTTGGNLSCKKVIHVVGPRWNDYKDKTVCLQHLEQTVFNSLEAAHSYKFQSLAVSSISSGIFRVPTEMCAQMYLASLQRFEEQHGGSTNLKDIHFVDINDHMVGLIQDIFTQFWDTRVTSSLIQLSDLETLGNQGDACLVKQTPETTVMSGNWSKTQATSSKMTNPNSELKTHESEKGEAMKATIEEVRIITGNSAALARKEFVTTSGIKVVVNKEDITKLKVDAIVNATDIYLKHSGGVSLAIAKAAGSNLKAEGDKYISEHGQLRVSDVVVTTAGNLPCQKVLHTVGPCWDNYQDKTRCQQDLIQTVFNCLEKAHSLWLTSLAVCCISSATFGIPKEICAEMYLSALKRFSQQYKNTSLKQIHFVDVNVTMVHVIQETFSKNWDNSNKPLSSGLHTLETVHYDNQDVTSLNLPRLDFSQDVYCFSFSCLVLVFERKKITEINTDAIFFWKQAESIFDDETRKQIIDISGGTFSNEDMRKTKKKLKDGCVDHTITANGKMLLFSVVPDNKICQDDVCHTMETLLFQVNKEKRKTIAIPETFYSRETASSSVSGLEAFAAGVYIAVEHYTHWPIKSVIEVHVLETNPDKLKTMVDTISLKVATDEAVIEAEKNQRPKIKDDDESYSAEIISELSAKQKKELIHNKSNLPLNPRSFVSDPGEFAVGVAVKHYIHWPNKSVTEVHVLETDPVNLTTMVDTVSLKIATDKSISDAEDNQRPKISEGERSEEDFSSAKRSQHNVKEMPAFRTDRNPTTFQTEIPSSHYKALVYFYKEKFSSLFDVVQEVGENMIVHARDETAFREINDKMNKIRVERMKLPSDLVSDFEDKLNDNANTIIALFVPNFDQGVVDIFSPDYGNMVKAKHLFNVTVGNIKVTLRRKQKLDHTVGDNHQLHLKTSSTVSKTTTIENFRTKSGIKVSVYEADVTQLTVDAIVCAANENLVHDGGEAAAIDKATGSDLRGEVVKYIQEYGVLKVTNVVPTSSGNLPCKKVLHAVGPYWHNYQEKALCQQHLEQTIFRALETAHKLKFATLAVCFSNSDIFAVPKDICARMYLAAVQRFDQQQGDRTSLQHIHFVDVNGEMVAIILDTFTRLWDATVTAPNIQL